MNGKGSKQRPCDKAKFDKGYERIFGGGKGATNAKRADEARRRVDGQMRPVDEDIDRADGRIPASDD